MLSWPHDQAVHNAYSSFLCCSGVSKCFHKTRSALSHENTKNHILQILLVQEDVCKKISLLFYLAFLNIQVRSRVHHLGITSSWGHIFCRRHESQNSRQSEFQILLIIHIMCLSSRQLMIARSYFLSTTGESEQPTATARP